MVVYVEYAFLENFVLDGVLLYLSLIASKTPVRAKNLLFSAAIGALFAVVYPLLVLPDFLLYALKIAVGLLLCLIVFWRLKGKKEWGRYAFICVCFFLLTFLFGGAITALGAVGAWVWLAFVFLSVFSVLLIKKLYEKRAREKYVYDCEIAYKQRRVAVLGFYDSGNFARFQDAPVCFISPELIFDLFEEVALGKEAGQVCDEIAITTVNGVKKTRLFKGELTIKEKQAFCVKEVYFAPAVNMLSRGYKLLLNSRIFEETGKER